MIVILTCAQTGKEIQRYPLHHEPSQWTIRTMLQQYGIVMTLESR